MYIKEQLEGMLKNYKEDDELKVIIYDFLNIGNEYTERVALNTLAHIYPERAEEYAIKFWNRNKYEAEEYQKMMALHVLYKIRSPKLKYYLELAEKFEFKYLKENAVKIREKIENQIDAND